MTHDRGNRNIQICPAKTYTAEFCNQIARQEAREENNNPQVFVPGSGAWHRHSKMKSIEGTFVSKKKSNKGRGKVYRNIHLGFGKQLQEAELVLAQKILMLPYTVFLPVAKNHLRKIS